MLKAEKVLACVMEFIGSLPDESKALIQSMVKEDSPNEYYAEGSLAEVILMCRQDIAEKANKASGKSAAAAASKRIFKQATKIGRCSGAFMEDGKQYIGGTYSVVRLNTPIATKEWDGKSDEHINYKDIIDKAKESNTVEVEIPSIPDIVKSVKLFKCEHEDLYYDLDKRYLMIIDTFHNRDKECDVIVDGEFLIDILTILSGENLKITRNYNPNSPIYISSDLGDGILCTCLYPGLKDIYKSAGIEVA